MIYPIEERAGSVNSVTPNLHAVPQSSKYAASARNAPVARSSATRNALGDPWAKLFCCAPRQSAQRARCAPDACDRERLYAVRGPVPALDFITVGNADDFT